MVSLIIAASASAEDPAFSSGFIFDPRPDRVAAYEERFGLYRRLYPAVKELSR